MSTVPAARHTSAGRIRPGYGPGRWELRRRDRTNRAARGGLTDRGRALVAAGLTLTISGVALGFVDLTRVGLLLIGLPWLTVLAYQATRPRLEVQHHVEPATLTVGQSARVQVAVSNRSGYPSLSVSAEEALSTDLGRRARFLLPGIPRRGVRTIEYSVLARRRGLHRIGPLTIRSHDPFGLTSAVLPLPGHADVMVLPVVHPLLGRAGQSAGSGNSGAQTPAPGQSGMEDASLREYQLGDDLRRIHWPVTAHRGELTVRHDGRAPVRQAVLCLDPSLPRGRDQDSPALDWAVEGLASIATHLAGLGYALRLATPAHVAAGRHGEILDLDETVRELALVAPQDGHLLETAGAGARPDAEGAATESRLVTAARDIAVGSSLIVLAVGAHDVATAHALLGTLPAGTAGIALILDPDGFAGGGRGEGRPWQRVEDGCDELLAFAACGGWRARVISGPEPIDVVWHDVSGGYR